MINLLQGALVFLPGSTIIQLHKEDYMSLITSYTDKDDLIKEIAKIKQNSKSLQFSKLEYSDEGIKSCELTEFLRFYDGRSINLIYSFFF